MKSTLRRAVFATAALSLVATACGSSDGASDTTAAGGTDTTAAGGTDTTAAGGTDTTAAGGDAAGGTRACIVLPDADSGTRWESGDRPALTEALGAGGFEADIQNAQSDTAKFATIVDQQLTKGCGVMILVDYQGAGIAATQKAQAQGVPVIAYDRPIEGADFYVSFDNFRVGELQGQTVLDGLEAAGKDPKTASVIYSSGDPADGNAKMFFDGAKSVLDAAGVTPAFEMAGTWDGAKAGTEFEQAYTAVQGKVDAVLAPNDNNASAIIAILDKNGVTAAVSGQDASVAGLQNVLLGKQTATVYKPFKVEAKVASDLAIALLNGETPSAPATLEDGTPFFASDPILVGPDQVKDVVAAGDVAVADLCAGDAAEACTEYGIS